MPIIETKADLESRERPRTLVSSQTLTASVIATVLASAITGAAAATATQKDS